MFEIGQQVVYGSHGICMITGMEQQNSGEKTIKYLVLEPLHQSGSRFLIPTHNTAAMSKLQKLLTKEEVVQLLHSEEVHTLCWIEDEGKRKQTYREMMGRGDRVQLMAMLYTLYQHKAQQAASGRKMHLCDDNFLRDTEKLLTNEISVVFNMDIASAKQYIRSCLQK